MERSPLHQKKFHTQKNSAYQKNPEADVQLHWYFFFHALPSYPVSYFHAMRSGAESSTTGSFLPSNTGVHRIVLKFPFAYFNSRKAGEALCRDRPDLGINRVRA